jgi:NADH-quinone oxidoreductase subunit M
MLSLILWTPLVAAFAVLATPGLAPVWVRRVSLALSLAHLALVVWVLSLLDPSRAGFQCEERAVWMPAIGAGYHLGVDGISRWLVLLNALLSPLAIAASWRSIQKNVRAFHAILFCLLGFVHGAFLALDGFLFFLFWEASLLAMFLALGVWGGERRHYATVKYVLYTMVGSMLWFAAMVWLALESRNQLGHLSFDYVEWKSLAIPVATQRLLFLGFFAAFAVKVPLFPFHTWQPDAYSEAPTAGSLLLAGVLLKMGVYGLMRFNQNLFPEAALLFQKPVMALALAGALFGGAMVLVQTDFKKAVAYSSLSHMGLCVLGLFSFSLAGQQGAVLGMVEHGLSTGALFLVVGAFTDRVPSRDLRVYGGAAAKAPVLALLFLPIALSSMGVPGTMGFVNEFLCLRGAFLADKGMGAAAALTLVLGAAYMLKLTQKVMYGPPASEAMERLEDIGVRERLSLGVLVGVILALGVYPNLILKTTEASVGLGLRHMAGLDRPLSGVAEPSPFPPAAAGADPAGGQP